MNFLDKWYENTNEITSPLLITPLVSKETVDFIYTTFKQFFPANTFEILRTNDTELTKTNWLIFLLANYKDIESIAALREVAELLTYLKSLDKSIQEEALNLAKSPSNFRSFLFELLIYQKLDQHQIDNVKKPKVGNQTAEGILKLNGTEYLYECRKLYFPKLKEFDIRKRIMDDFRKIEKFYHPQGVICTIDLKEPITGEHRNHFKKIIETYSRSLKNRPQNSKLECKDESIFGQFTASEFSKARFIEVSEIKKPDILFYIRPIFDAITNKVTKHKGEILSNFSVNETDIYKKLRSNMKEKRKQHKKSTFTKRIIFFDSQHLPDFQMGMFQGDLLFDFERLKHIYEELKMDEIVCLIRRKHVGFSTHFKLSIIHRNEEVDTIKKIKELFS